MCALLGSYAAYNGNSLHTFRENRFIPSSKCQANSLSLQMVLEPNFLILDDGPYR